MIEEKKIYPRSNDKQIVYLKNVITDWEKQGYILSTEGNVVVDTDPAGNIKVTKARSKEKIDGIVAAIMALDRAQRNEGPSSGSVYDEMGLLVL